MIDLTLDFLCKQVNEYLVKKLKLNATDNAIMLYNVSQLGSEGAGGGGSGDTTTNAFLTLVNIEEDRISKSQENFIRKDGKIVYQNPKVNLNLQLLFSANLSSY